MSEEKTKISNVTESKEIIRSEGPVDLAHDYTIFITDIERDEDSLIQLQNITLKNTIRYAESLAECEEPPCAITIFDSRTSEVMASFLAELDDDGELTISKRKGEVVDNAG